MQTLMWHATFLFRVLSMHQRESREAAYFFQSNLWEIDNHHFPHYTPPHTEPLNLTEKLHLCARVSGEAGNWTLTTSWSVREKVLCGALCGWALEWNDSVARLNSSLFRVKTLSSKARTWSNLNRVYCLHDNNPAKSEKSIHFYSIIQ